MEIAVKLSFYNNTDTFGRSFPLKILRKSSAQEREKKLRHHHVISKVFTVFDQKSRPVYQREKLLLSYREKCSGDEVIQFEKKWKMKHLKLSSALYGAHQSIVESMSIHRRSRFHLGPFHTNSIRLKLYTQLNSK